MSLLTMAIRRLTAHPVTTGMTLFSLLLPVALLLSILVLHEEGTKSLKRGAGTVDLIIGAKGSPLQLVLSTLYQMDQPTGNIAYSVYEKWRQDPRVRQAVPMSVGDNYRGHRIIGTTQTLFALQREDPFFEFKEGRAFEGGFEGVVGSLVAASTGLQIGARFHGSHGLWEVEGAQRHEAFTYRVVGILEPTGTALDRAIYVPQSAVWKVHHAEQSVHHVFGSPQNDRPEITAVLVQLHAAGLRTRIAEEVRKVPPLMAAIPINEMLRFTQIILSPIEKILLFVTTAVGVVAVLLMLLTLSQSAERYQPELAILRCLGARRADILRLLFYEVFFLVTAGMILGWLGARAILFFLAIQAEAQFGLILSPWARGSSELPILIGLYFSALFIGIVPALRVYRSSPIVLHRR